MNIIDFLLALVFFCAVGLYAFKLHKKRVKARAETAREGTPGTAQGSPPDPELARALAQAFQINPHIVGTMADNPALTGVKFCKLVPVKLEGIPTGLPFGETYDSSGFNKSLMTASYEVNEELKAISDTGFTALNVTPLLLCCDMLILCITAGKTGTAGTARTYPPACT